MSDELNVCAAAFFRSIGKDVVTPKEFTMYVTLDVKWMSSKEASALMQVLIEEKAMVSSNGYLKPGKDFSALQVPIAYRPTDAVRNAVAAKMKKGKTQTPAGKASGADTGDIFPELVALSGEYGWSNKGKFIAECNSVRKKLGVETAVAALLVLRDSGADVKELTEKVYANSVKKG